MKIFKTALVYIALISLVIVIIFGVPVILVLAAINGPLAMIAIDNLKDATNKIKLFAKKNDII